MLACGDDLYKEKKNVAEEIDYKRSSFHYNIGKRVICRLPQRKIEIISEIYGI